MIIPEGAKERVRIFRVLGILILFILACLLIVFSEKPVRKENMFFTGPKRKPRQSTTILFDAFKGQVWSIKDTGFAGYSSLNLFLKNLGYHTEENHRPYREALEGLGPETLLVIGVAMEAKFTDDEIASIIDFVERGGKVLVIAEHDNKYNSADFLRPIINVGGWDISNDHVEDPNIALPGTAGRWIRTLLPSKEEGPVLLCAATLQPLLDDVCEVLLTSLEGGHIVAGRGRFGKGIIVIVADSEFLWNANPDYKLHGLYPLAFNEPKTRAFVKDLISTIHPVQGMRRSYDFSFPRHLQGSKRVFIYGNGYDLQQYSKFLDALKEAGISVLKYKEGIRPEDGVIVISRLNTIPGKIIDDLAKSEKMVLFGDMYSCLESYADSWKHFFKPQGIYPVPYPMNALAEKYGVQFLQYFGVNFDDNENGNILYVPVFFNGRRLCLHRACAVKFLEQNESSRLRFENSEGTFACGAGFGLNHSLKSKDPNDMENPEFLVVTENVFAIGDSDIITDAFFPEAEHAGIIDEIIKFLKS